VRLLALAIVPAVFASGATIHTSVDLQAYLYGSGVFASCSQAGTTNAACSITYGSGDPSRPYQVFGAGSVAATDSSITISGILQPGSGIPGTPVSLVGNFSATITQPIALNAYPHLTSPYALVKVSGTWNSNRSTYMVSAAGATSSMDGTSGVGSPAIDRAFAVPLQPTGTTMITLSVWLTANEYDMPGDWGLGVAPAMNLAIAPLQLYNGDPLAEGAKLAPFTVSDVPEPGSGLLVGSSIVLFVFATVVVNYVGMAVPRRNTLGTGRDVRSGARFDRRSAPGPIARR
jgi:hypothetical protein